MESNKKTKTYKYFPVTTIIIILKSLIMIHWGSYTKQTEDRILLDNK